MNKTLIFLILSTCTIILSISIIAVGPITNNKIGLDWGTKNCQLLSDQVELLKDDVTKMKKMKNLCYRQKAMHDMEYTSFIINIILGFLCADLALIHYLGYGKDFEIKTGVIGLIAGIIGFVLALVYVCYSGYIFTEDVANQEIIISLNTYNLEGCIPKLYSDGALYKFKVDQNNANAGKYITENENDRSDYANCIRYKDLGKKVYNYDSEYYKKYNDYDNSHSIDGNCKIPSYKDDPLSDYQTTISQIKQSTSKRNNCENYYNFPETENKNKDLFDRWLTALILACFVLVCDLGLAFFGLLLCSNFGQSSL